MSSLRLAFVAILIAAAAVPAHAQRGEPAAVRSAPITAVRYELAFDRAGAQRRTVRVTMHFDVASSREVLLSMPAWTPGAYQLTYFARRVSAFRAVAAGQDLRWDKLDYDTWRIRPHGAGRVSVFYDVLADTLDNAMAWATADFVMLNGTNVFLYPEAAGADFDAQVSVSTEPDWLIATGMRSGGAPRSYRESNYHDLVDMPFFIGSFDLDSVRSDSRWLRLATYPRGALAGAAREQLWSHIRGVIPPMERVFGEIPFESYTTLLIFSESFGGGSALEHQNSHVGIYNPQFVGSGILTNITAHEIFHAWNVKRLRPSELTPYRYDVAQPTPLLWVSEGFTSYYADLSMARAGLVDEDLFGQLVLEHAQSVLGAPPVALEDASLETWIRPTDGTAYIYYSKGALAGLLLDILIRDATDNRASLDDVMRALYQNTWRRGRGFTTAEFFAQVERTAGRSFAEFYRRYVDGRDPFPLAEVLPLGGYRWEVTVRRDPRLGVQTLEDSLGISVAAVVEGGAMAEGGAAVGDRIVRVGEIPIVNAESFAQFRARYGQSEGEVVAVVVRRDDQELTLRVPIRLVASEQQAVVVDGRADSRARRIREGILTGSTGR
jgi:predicted metalloprotease with PDZ domain